VYVKLIEKYFTGGQQVLYLLPEIALTTQIIRRLQKHFGGNITIYFDIDAFIVFFYWGFKFKLHHYDKLFSKKNTN
jgi:hypothetical protein